MVADGTHYEGVFLGSGGIHIESGGFHFDSENPHVDPFFVVWVFRVKGIRREDIADFEMYMRPTIDFSGYLLSRGSLIKVLMPQWLADEIHDMHLDAAAMYEPKEENQRE